MRENSLMEILRESGRKPSECRCVVCQNQCRTPCLGTPEDILMLIDAGYGDRLKPTLWLVGVALGRLDYPIPMVQAMQTDEGWCTFFKDGLCELHDLGLKPTEGKLAHHTMTDENYDFTEGLAYQVAKEWLGKSQNEIITEIVNYLCNRDE